MTIKENRHRYFPKKDFPIYAFVPGKHPHPNKEGGHSFDQEEPHPKAMELEKPFESEAFLYGMDLFNHGYYWESHVYFEALWNASNRKGRVADFLKGLIKLGAAGVKIKLEQKGSARGHIQRGRELFESCQLDDYVAYCDTIESKLDEFIEEEKLLDFLEIEKSYE